MKQYGIGTGLPDAPVGLDEENTKLMMPVYRALASMAQQLSDVTGVTIVPGTDIQDLGSLAQHDGFRTRKLSFEAGENITASRFIHLDNTAGESRIWQASSLNAVNRRAHGVCIEPGGIVSGSRGRVLLFQGLLAGLSGLTPGTVYYLGASGGILAIPPGAGSFVQPVGLAVSTSVLAITLTLT